MQVHAPSERNPKLAGFLAAANASDRLKALWHAQQMTAQRLGMSDHSWVHLQIVLNSALRIFRLLRRADVPSPIQTDYGMRVADAEVVIAGGCLLHDLGMSIHRVDHESFSLFLAADLLGDLLPTSTTSPSGRSSRRDPHAIIGHRRGGRRSRSRPGSSASPTPWTWSMGARASRSRPTCPTSTRCRRRRSTRSGSWQGEQRAIRVEVEMNNSAGVFQVDDLLASKLRGSGLE